MAVILLAVNAPSLIGLFDGRATSITIDTFVYGILLGIGVSGIFFWMFYGPGRRLFHALCAANPDLRVVPVYSSDELIRGMEDLNGARLTSSDLPSGAYLVFVDAGRQFELWRSHRGRPERVIRLPWAAIDSIEIGTISHLVIADRALVLNVKSGERIVRIPVAPLACRAARLTPVKDEVFNDFLTHLQSRVIRSRLDAEPRVPDSIGKPGNATT